jgi:AraC-like DNA-binding protein
LARLCQISPRQLERYFRERFGRTPQEWLDEVRLHEAPHFLRGGKLVKEVAFELGFVHPSHFIRKFKQFYRCTPLKFSLADGTEPFGAASPSPSPSAA